MSPKQLLSTALILISGSLFSQNYLKVDQNPNAPTGDHVYSNLQECIDAASDGDIIHIIPATDHYGDIILNKAVHLVGAGWVSDNQSGTTSKINKITIDALSADGATLNGLVLVLNSNFPLVFGIENAPVDTLENIEIFNCKISGVLQLDNTPIKNMLLRNNVFSELSYDGGNGTVTLNFITDAGMTENLNISNNIIVANLAGGYAKNCLSAANQTIIKNNLLYTYNGQKAFYILKNSFISNNVFYGAGTLSQSVSTGNAFTNNLSYACGPNCALPPASTSAPGNSGTGNLANTYPSLAYISNGFNWNINFQLELLASSPLENAGSDGTDIGVTGGEYPFNNYNNLRGVPYVHQFGATGIVMEGQDIQIDAVLRSNQ